MVIRIGHSKVKNIKSQDIKSTKENYFEDKDKKTPKRQKSTKFS